MKPVTDKQQKLMDNMKDYGCRSFHDWMLDHPDLKHKCSYTASLYIKDNMDFYLEQRKYLS